MSVDIRIGDRSRSFSVSGFDRFICATKLGHVFDGESGSDDERYFLFEGDRVPALGRLTMVGWADFANHSQIKQAHLSLFENGLAWYKKKSLETHRDRNHCIAISEWFIESLKFYLENSNAST